MHRFFYNVVFAALNLVAQSSDIARLEALRKQDPADAVVLYNLAAEYASAGRQSEVLPLLQKMPVALGGLDPSVYRGFVFLHGNPSLTEKQ